VTTLFWALSGILLVLLLSVGVYAFVDRRTSHRPDDDLVDLASGQSLPLATVEMVGSHSWGKATLKRFHEEDYNQAPVCLNCKRTILDNQFFWETPLADTNGLSFAICMSCQPGDVRYTQE
jgi:hypothetical protein